MSKITSFFPLTFTLESFYQIDFRPHWLFYDSYCLFDYYHFQTYHDVCVIIINRITRRALRHGTE